MEAEAALHAANEAAGLTNPQELSKRQLHVLADAHSNQGLLFNTEEKPSMEQKHFADRVMINVKNLLNIPRTGSVTE